MLNELPRYDFLQEIVKTQQEVDSSACDLFLSILRTGGAVSSLEASYLGAHKITPGRFAVMLLLGIDESIVRKPSELAEMIGVTRATMTGLLDTLERDNYVGRTLDPTDRRSMRVVSTPECRELLKRVLPDTSKSSRLFRPPSPPMNRPNSSGYRQKSKLAWPKRRLPQSLPRQKLTRPLTRSRMPRSRTILSVALVAAIMVAVIGALAFFKYHQIAGFAGMKWVMPPTAVTSLVVKEEAWQPRSTPLAPCRRSTVLP